MAERAIRQRHGLSYSLFAVLVSYIAWRIYFNASLNVVTIVLHGLAGFSAWLAGLLAHREGYRDHGWRAGTLAVGIYSGLFVVTIFIGGMVTNLFRQLDMPMVIGNIAADGMLGLIFFLSVLLFSTPACLAGTAVYLCLLWLFNRWGTFRAEGNPT